MIDFSSLVNPTPRQLEFLGTITKHPFTLYGGARGGGKSYILRWTAVFLLLRWFTQGHRGVRVGIFCETFPELKERQLSRAIRGRIEERFPLWLGKWNLEDKEFRLNDHFGGGIIAFRNLDDPAKYQSSEFAAILVDELTRNDSTVFNALRGSLRWPGIEHTPFIGATNPGGIGHAWVKDMFVDKTFHDDANKAFIEPDERTGIVPYQRSDFAYVKALATDNPHNASSYLKMLRSLPPRLRAAFLDGNWDVFEGQAFDEWNRDVHVKENRIAHLKHWRLVVGLDWGFRKGDAVLCAIGPEGDVEVVHEIEFSKINAEDAGKAFGERWTRLGLKPDAIIYDEQMDQDTSHLHKGNTTLKEQLLVGLVRHYGSFEKVPPLVPGPHAPGSRKVKYDLTHKYLRYKVDVNNHIPPWFRPRLTVQKRCKYLIRTLPALQVDPDAPEDDVDKKSPDDHGYDALGFVLMSRVFDDTSDRDEPKKRDPNRHPGFDPKSRGRKPAATDMPAQEPEEELSWNPGWEMPRQETLVEVED